jgi:hypothetical protein
MTAAVPATTTKPVAIEAPRHRVSYVSRVPFDENRVGAAAVYCSDGRFGEQMDEFLHTSLGLPRYDRVAVPGGAACLAGHLMVYHEKNAMEQQLGFLIQSHSLNRVVLIAHENCGFYRGLWTGGKSVEQQQAEDLEKAAEQIRSRSPGVVVEAYFARRVEGRVAFERWDAGHPNGAPTVETINGRRAPTPRPARPEHP